MDEVLPSWRRPDDRLTLAAALEDRRPWPADDPVAQLVWLAIGAAKPWVPTV
jgi:hypothetical protein